MTDTTQLKLKSNLNNEDRIGMRIERLETTINYFKENVLRTVDSADIMATPAYETMKKLTVELNELFCLSEEALIETEQ